MDEGIDQDTSDDDDAYEAKMIWARLPSKSQSTRRWMRMTAVRERSPWMEGKITYDGPFPFITADCLSIFDLDIAVSIPVPVDAEWKKAGIAKTFSFLRAIRLPG